MFNIPILYRELFFEEEPHHYLWGFNQDGIGLIGTYLMNDISKRKGTIFHGVEELRKHLKTFSDHNK